MQREESRQLTTLCICTCFWGLSFEYHRIWIAVYKYVMAPFGDKSSFTQYTDELQVICSDHVISKSYPSSHRARQKLLTFLAVVLVRILPFSWYTIKWSILSVKCQMALTIKKSCFNWPNRWCFYSSDGECISASLNVVHKWESGCSLQNVHAWTFVHAIQCIYWLCCFALLWMIETGLSLSAFCCIHGRWAGRSEIRTGSFVVAFRFEVNLRDLECSPEGYPAAVWIAHGREIALYVWRFWLRKDDWSRATGVIGSWR